MNNAAQLNARIRKLADELKVNPQILLRYYMMEHLLERIAHSEYKRHFILKGGMLIASMTGLTLRSTMDIDAMMDRIPASLEDIKRIFEELAEVDDGSGIKMSLENIHEIREDADYMGYRISMAASFGRIKQKFKVDISVVDIVVPEAVDYEFNLLFNRGSIELPAYRIETVLAEKIETILSRGTANTRMRDYYDVYLLTKLYSKRIDYTELKSALYTISIRRGSNNLLDDYSRILKSIETPEILSELWDGYTNKNAYADKTNWLDVYNAVESIFGAVLS